MISVFSASVLTWVALIAIVLILALYRLAITRGDYTVLHVRRSELSMIPQQILQTRRLQIIDSWGRWITALVLIFGTILAAVYLYAAATLIPQP